ncbi:MAG: lipoyl synthase [Bacteriovoracia bacterium]
MAIFRELPVLDGWRELPENVLASAEDRTHMERPLAPSVAAQVAPVRKPGWLKIRPPGGENYLGIKKLLRERNLHTVCEEAHCPNVAECWAGGTATFMLGGDTCTRACRFCAIKTARIPPPLDPLEPAKTAESVAALNLKYVVLTSVDRDDLADGGAAHFAETIREIKRRQPGVIIEALVPDFRGNATSIRTIVDSGLDVYAHNIETVRRLHYRVRDPRAGYLQSMATLKLAKDYARATGRTLYTKSSIMMGFGETEQEILQTAGDLRKHEVDVLTLGQYLRPSLTHLPVERYWSPEEFESLKTAAADLGFLYIAGGPMVRSSYKAAEFFIEGVIRKHRSQMAEPKAGGEARNGI